MVGRTRRPSLQPAHPIRRQWPTRAIKRLVRAMKLIMAPDQVTELRALGVSTPEYRRTHTVSGYFDDIHALAEAAMQIAPYAMGIYFTPNPMNAALLARAANRARPINQEPLSSDSDVVARRWLLVDIDAIRPAGISSTDAEHDAAITKAMTIREALAARGWPEPSFRGSAEFGTSQRTSHHLRKQDIARRLTRKEDGLYVRNIRALRQHPDIDQNVQFARLEPSQDLGIFIGSASVPGELRCRDRRPHVSKRHPPSRPASSVPH